MNKDEKKIEKMNEIFNNQLNIAVNKIDWDKVVKSKNILIWQCREAIEEN